MSLTILNVAFPLAPVGPGVVGGAEQIVHRLDRGLVDAGHRSLVLACEGSRTVGELIPSPAPAGRIDERAHAEAIRRYRVTIERVVATRSVDVVHFHGHDFDAYLPPEGVPVLATLHLPPELTRADITRITRPGTWVHGVSRAQHRRLPCVPILLPPIDNGVDADELPRDLRRRSFAAVLGRICPEKGVHRALEAAKRAGCPILVAGMVFPYAEHERYFAEEVLPRLGRQSRYVGAVSGMRKRRLLSTARCLLVPSTAAETSSLVAMEALACGTPVIAFDSGALSEVIEDGVTGFLVRSVDEMADAVQRANEIDADRCRQVARRRFSATRMVEQYLERYGKLLSGSRPAAENRSSCESIA